MTGIEAAMAAVSDSLVWGFCTGIGFVVIGLVIARASGGGD